FFFQAEDGIRDFHVTGVQTCALPISPSLPPWRLPPPSPPARGARASRLPPPRGSRPPPTPSRSKWPRPPAGPSPPATPAPPPWKIGRASCREGAQSTTGRSSATTTAT